MALIEDFFSLLDSLLGSAAYFPIALLGVGLIFTVYLGFPQIRFFKHAWSVLTGKHTSSSDPGDTSHFQALSTALSGTVGTGNIGGVAFAIFLGGACSPILDVGNGIFRHDDQVCGSLNQPQIS